MIGFSGSTIKVTSWAAAPGSGSAGVAGTPITTTPLSFAFNALTAQSIGRAVAGSSSAITVLDRLLSRTTTSTTMYDQQMQVSWSGTLPETVSWASSNPSVASVNASGFVTHLTNGSTTITASSSTYSATLSLSLQSSGAGIVDTLTGWVSGSLAHHISANVDSRIAGKTASTALPLFSSQNHTTPAFTRNTACWAHDLGTALASISPSNTSTNNLWAGAAVSPRHVIFCAHAAPPDGCVMRFVTTDNQVVTRTLMTKSGIGASIGYGMPDVLVGVLDSDLPNTVPFAKVLPDNWASYLPSLTTMSVKYGLPALCLDQEEKALVTDLHTLFGYGPVAFAYFSFPAGLNAAKRGEFYEGKVGGDSGNPAYLIINGELVLICVWTFGGAGQGTNIQAWRSQVNATMTNLGGGYQLTNVDLSGFPTY
jgi:hypothetical protein